MHAEIQELQAWRKHYIKGANRLILATGAMTRRALGFQPGNEDAAQKELVKRAARIVSDGFSGKPWHEDDQEIGSALASHFAAMSAALDPIERARHQIELDMKRRARALPVWSSWAKGVHGFGELGLAVIVGEAGDIGSYRSDDGLKKRLGLAPYFGQAYSTWRKEGGLTASTWTEAGYNPARLGQVFGVVTSPLFRAQATVKGQYHALYLARRERTAITHPEWTKGHSHNDAMRIMTQRLISDLWSEWRRANQSSPVRADVSAPASTPLSEAA